MRRNKVVLFMGLALCGFAYLSTAPLSSAQSQQLAPSAALPSDADLDAMLAAQNWQGLGAALSQPGNPQSVPRAMNWLKTRIDNGGGFFLTLLYARDLWAMGSSLKIDEPSKDLRLTAGMISLYSYELIVIDGAKCEDQTAPGHRLDQLIMSRAATFAYLKNQTPELKGKIVDLAVALEKKTAPLRKDDDLICRGGLQQMQAGLQSGKQHEVATPPGQIGKTVAVEPPPNWVPKFVSPNIYKPAQDKARSDMRATLLKQLG